MDGHQKTSSYGRLLIMAGLSFIAMYVLMYAMVDTFNNVFSNVNQFYMAGLMTAAMAIIELSIMGAMYHNKTANALVIVISALVLVIVFIGLRQQTGISDKQFLKSMIPHHASALLMCQRANLKDAEIKALCQDILSSQQEQIDQMKQKLQTLEGG